MFLFIPASTWKVRTLINRWSSISAESGQSAVSRSNSGGQSSGWSKLISESADCLYVLVATARIQQFSQALHIHIDSSRADLASRSPNLAEQERARAACARISHEKFQQSELQGAHWDEHAVNP